MLELSLDESGIPPRTQHGVPLRAGSAVGDFSSTHVTGGATATRPAPANQRTLTAIGNYRVLQKLGEGGMGAVYLAEAADGRQVAVKVLPHRAIPDEHASRRFQKEARLLAEVSHPNVTNLLDWGTSDDAAYLVMEYVEGLDLKQLLTASGALSEQSALRIARDVASALESAHVRGIVHRDIKPANILIADPSPGAAGETAARIRQAIDSLPMPVVKLSDFGLARQIDQTESMRLTQTGAMLGTPYYIAPEQCTGRGDVTPAADVYSLGAMLFELLANRPPFQAADAVKLIALHCFEDAPDIRKLVPGVSDGAARLLATMLQKDPEARFPDAKRVRFEIERLLRGEVGQVAIHPLTPLATRGVIETTWEWNLHSPPDRLWPLVSNTDRINSAVGLPAVQYRTDRDEHGAIRKTGDFQLGFAKLEWREFPFEWVEGRRLGVLREFSKGPFHWFLSLVELEPTPTGGTRLKHTVRIAPKGLIGRLLARLEVNLKGSKALDRVYQRIDSVVSGRLSGTESIDPFVPPPALAKSTQNRFGILQSALEQTDVDHECADALVQFLMESPAAELARIRPQALARRLSLPGDQLTDACLHACQVGLLGLHWDILCPTCRVSTTVKDTVKAIEKHVHCEACDLDFEVDFANAVELIFRVHPDLRLADLKTYCLGGPEHAPHVVSQTRLNAGEILELDLQLSPGAYQLRGPQLPYTISLQASPQVSTTQLQVALSRETETRIPLELRSGRATICLENRYDRPVVARIERVISRADVLTAAEAGKSPIFRKLFPGEVVSRENLSEMSACTLLAVRMDNVARIFDRWGDVDGDRRLRARMAEIRQSIEAGGGQIVRNSDHQLLAAFTTTRPAINAAASLMTSPAVHEIPLRVALHRGTALSTSVDGRTDFVGRVVTQALALLDDRSDRPFVLSADLLADVEVLELVAKADLNTKAPACVALGPDVHTGQGKFTVC